MSDASLRGKRILVTGASSEVGAAIAELAAGEGATVALHYAGSRDTVDALMARMPRGSGPPIALQADLLNDRTWAPLVGDVIHALGGLDCLVNNAGAILQPLTIAEMTLDAWDQNFRLNTAAPFFLAREAFGHMEKNGGGRIVNISSIGVKFGGSPNSLHYSAAKLAVEQVTAGLAKLGAPAGILVNAVRCGIVESPIHAHQSPEAMQRRRDLIPMKRFASPIEIARLVTFLLGPGGDFITGQVLAVSGGE